MENKTNTRKKVIIIGAGFGGIHLAKALRKSKVDVLVIDQHNYHTFQPLLYQVATGGLEAENIGYPVRRIFRKYDNVRFQLANVKSIDHDQKIVISDKGNYAYDIAIIATGSTNNFFNFEPVKDKLYCLKSIEDAMQIRNMVILNLETAASTKDTDEITELLNIAIVGGGPAGIELAGALAEMKRYVFPKDFPEVDISHMSITLYEAAPKLLSVMSEEASKKSHEYLSSMGVDVKLNSKVKDYDGHKVTLDDGSTFATNTVVWTAGVKGNPIGGLPQESIVGNRISVNEYNQVIGLEDVYAVGDVSVYIDDTHKKGQPMLAQVAMQQGKLLADNIKNNLQGNAMKPFAYNDKGVMATVGRNKAVVDLPRWKFQGVFAWFVWMFIHLFSLVGYRSKVKTFWDWAGNYLSFDSPLGIVIWPQKKQP